MDHDKISTPPLLTLIRRRLAYRVAASAAALALFFVLALGGVGYTVLASSLRGQAQSSLQAEALLRADRVGDVLTGLVAALHGLADNRAIGLVAADRQGMERFLLPMMADMARANGVQAILAATDAGGRVLAASERLRADADRQPWVAAAIGQGRTLARIAIGDTAPGLELAQPLAPVGNGGGALLLRIDLADLARTVALPVSGDLQGWLDLVADETPLSLRLGQPVQPDLPEQDAMGASSMVPVPDALASFRFAVRVLAERQRLSAALDRLTILFLAVGAVLVLLVLASALLLGRRLTGKLSRLAEAAEAYAFDETAADPFAVTGDDEIARLGQVFSGMVSRLDLAYQDLERRSQTLLSNAERVAHVGSASWDLRSGRQAWSDEFHAILGLPAGGCLPSIETFLERVHGEDRPRLEAVLRSAAGREERVVEDFRILGAGGAERVLHIQAEVVQDRDGKPLRLDATLQDITERKRLEERLDGLIRELRRSNEELEQFAYVASHDLRQPLRVVGSYVTLLEQELGGDLSGEAREFITFARDGVKRMDQLIVDLLAYSRVGRASRDEPIDTARAAAAAIADLQFEVDAAGGEIFCADALPVVLGDESEMARLFLNLIGNAVKYRTPDRPPRIAVRCAEQSDGWHFQVEDNGIGIPSEHAERVFGIFQRLHARHEYEGTGIGLAICRKIVERHGGRIWAEPNADGQGTTLHFIWPKLASAERAA